MTKVGMSGHQSTKAQTHTWITPREVVDAVGPFDLDPCAALKQPWPCAARQFTETHDGLLLPWSGLVWMNPPYGPHIGAWLRKLADHGTGVALIFARIETAAWFEEIWPKASAILFLKGRLRFCRESGVPGTNTGGAPSALIAYGTMAATRLARSNIPGAFLDFRGAKPAILDRGILGDLV